LAEAEGRRAQAEAENSLSQSIVEMRIAFASLQAPPAIIAEMLKLTEKISSIKIHQISSLGGENMGAVMAAGWR